VDHEVAPDLADYDALVVREVVWVLDVQQQDQGIVVLYPQSESLFIENAAVHPDAQGRGYGYIETDRRVEDGYRRVYLTERL
jgi:hypothetical protein